MKKLATLATFLLPAAALAAPVCPPCPGGTTDISLMLASPQLASDREHWGFSLSTFAHKAPAKLPHYGPLVAQSVEEVRAKILEQAKLCRRIKYWQSSTRGAHGYVEYGQSVLNVLTVSDVLKDLDCAMAPKAEIFFDGYDVARGCRGEDFLARVSSLMLTKGGTVGGYTNYSLGGALGFDLKTQKAKLGGGDQAVPRSNWEYPPESAQSCQARAEAARKDLDSFKQKIGESRGCFTPDETEFANNVSQQMTSVALEQAKVTDRFTFTPATFTAAGNYYRAFGNYDYVLANLKERDCSVQRPAVNGVPAATAPDADAPPTSEGGGNINSGGAR